MDSNVSPNATPIVSECKPGLPKRYAVLSMDIEDWHHLDYFRDELEDRSYSMLDGLDVYLEILDRLGVPSSFFCVGDIASGIAPRLKAIADRGYEVGSHTYSHRRPLTLSIDEFREELRRSKRTIEEITQKPASGFRAPCFSMDEARLDAVREAGFAYDSSRIDFSSHPLYGTLTLNGFTEVGDYTYRSGGFFEFEMPTISVLGRNLPISGGGYLRIFPWLVMRRWINRFADQHTFYTLYIHPFELSRRKPPRLPPSVSWKTQKRFTIGLGRVENKLIALIRVLRDKGFTFTTFADLCRQYGAGATIASPRIAK